MQSVAAFYQLNLFIISEKEVFSLDPQDIEQHFFFFTSFPLPNSPWSWALISLCVAVKPKNLHSFWSKSSQHVLKAVPFFALHCVLTYCMSLRCSKEWFWLLDFVFTFSTDLLPKTVESVFIFQEASEGEPNAAAPTYDAIVVEQWTIIDVSLDICLLLIKLVVCLLAVIHWDEMIQQIENFSLRLSSLSP